MVLGISANGQDYEEIKPAAGKKSGTGVRMPLVLADIWTFTEITNGDLAVEHVANGFDNRSCWHKIKLYPNK